MVSSSHTPYFFQSLAVSPQTYVRNEPSNLYLKWPGNLHLNELATYTWMSWQLNLQTKKFQFIDSLRKPNNIKWRDKVNNVHARVITPGACSPRCTRDVRIWQFSYMTYNSLKGSTSLEFKDLSCYASIFINFHFLCTVCFVMIAAYLLSRQCSIGMEAGSRDLQDLMSWSLGRKCFLNGSTVQQTR